VDRKIKVALPVTIYVLVAVWVYIEIRGLEPLAFLEEKWEGGQSAYLTESLNTQPTLSFDAGTRSGIIDMHEQVRNRAQANLLLKVMDKVGISRTCLAAAPLNIFTQNPQHRYEKFHDNNALLLDLKREHPRRLCVFVTLDPLHANNVDILKKYIQQGASGVKLYLGHPGRSASGPYHVMPMTDPRLYSLLRYLQHQRIPNVFTDISLGRIKRHIAGFEAWAASRQYFKQFLTDHADRIMFASGVLSESASDEQYLLNNLGSYMFIMEKPVFQFFHKPARGMRGLELEDETLQKIYQASALNFLLSDR